MYQKSWQWPRTTWSGYGEELPVALVWHWECMGSVIIWPQPSGSANPAEHGVVTARCMLTPELPKSAATARWLRDSSSNATELLPPRTRRYSAPASLTASMTCLAAHPSLIRASSAWPAHPLGLRFDSHANSAIVVPCRLIRCLKHFECRLMPSADWVANGDSVQLV